MTFKIKPNGENILEEEYKIKKQLKEINETNFGNSQINKAWENIDNAIECLRNVPLKDMGKCNQIIKVLWDAQDMINKLYENK